MPPDPTRGDSPTQFQNLSYPPVQIRKQWYDPKREFRVEESQAVLNVQWGIV